MCITRVKDEINQPINRVRDEIIYNNLKIQKLDWKNINDEEHSNENEDGIV